jgi:hypothetical protein
MSPPFCRSHPAVYIGSSCVIRAGFIAAGPPTALVTGSVTAQRPRPHQLRGGAAGIGNLEDGGSNGARSGGARSCGGSEARNRPQL